MLSQTLALWLWEIRVQGRTRLQGNEKHLISFEDYEPFCNELIIPLRKITS